jgi:hypothetical protein
MHFTYGAVLTDVSNVADCPLDWVRFLIGDTAVDDEQNQLLSDEEILALIGTDTDKDTLHSAAADAAEAIATKFRKYPPERVGSLSNSDPRYIVQQYEELAEILRSHIAGTPFVYAGGINRDKYPRAFTSNVWEDFIY